MTNSNSKKQVELVIKIEDTQTFRYVRSSGPGSEWCRSQIAAISISTKGSANYINSGYVWAEGNGYTVQEDLAIPRLLGLQTRLEVYCSALCFYHQVVCFEWDELQSVELECVHSGEIETFGSFMRDASSDVERVKYIPPNLVYTS
jgi:hypothetical protein